MTITKNLQVIPVLPGKANSLESYIYQVNQIPMLTEEQEGELANRWYQLQDIEAARQLAAAHLRFVVKISRGYAGYGLSQEDLIQEGNVGLLKAVKRFDPTVGVRLVSFAVHWIKAEIHEFILRNWRIVKIATTKAQRKLFFNLRNSKKRLGWFTKDEIKEVAEVLNVSAKDVLKMEERMSASDLSFDAPVDTNAEDNDHYSPIHYIEDKRYEPAKVFENDDWSEQAKDKLVTALSALDQRSQDIIRQRWLVEKKATLHDLADKYQISAERIRQLENQAIGKLRSAIVD